MIRIGILNQALDEVQKSRYYPYRVGAVVFKGPRVLSAGHNKYGPCSRIHPKYRMNLTTTHAEQDALIGLNWGKIRGSEILVIRCGRDGRLLMARPCKICFNLILHVGVKAIYYSNRNGEIVREKL